MMDFLALDPLVPLFMNRYVIDRVDTLSPTFPKERLLCHKMFDS